MEKLLQIYHEVFPHTSMADWIYAFFGLLLHAIVKLKNVLREFKWRIFIGEFLPVWFFSIMSIVILLGAVPQVLSSYNVLDSALIGYTASSIIKQLLKSRMGNLNVLSNNLKQS